MNLPEPIETILGGLNRPMPCEEETERGLLSCILQEPRRLMDNFNAMPSTLFYHWGNREVFMTLVDELVANRPIDPISITRRLREAGTLDKVGGPAAISELYAFVPLPSHFPYYLGTLRSLLIKRQNIEAHARSLELLFTSKEESLAKTLDDVKGLLEEAGKMQGQALKSRTLAESIESWLDGMEDRQKNPGRLPGVSTGFSFLDKRTGGMQPGKVWVFAGEPWDGKSTILQNCAESAARLGHKVRWYPLEMPEEEQTHRLVSSDSRVDNETLYSAILNRAEQSALATSIRRLKDLPIEIVDVEDATATDIFADIERSDARIIVVDYLQLYEDISARKSDTRETVLSGISRRQKRLARRTGKTILTASQLNDNGKLRESRAIGQDADFVSTIEKFWLDDKMREHDDERRRLRNDKNRGGRRGWKMDMRFLGSVFQFREDSEP